jgi:steroid delta-isomerase-like uncharacterized protein
MTQQDQNRALAIEWMNVAWNKRDDEAVHRMLAPDGVGHCEGQTLTGPLEFLQFRNEMVAAFPDLKIEIVASVAEGDTVALRWKVTGTHTGHAMGLTPSGRQIAPVGSTWITIRDGKLVEGHDTWNQAAMFASLTAPA